MLAISADRHVLLHVERSFLSTSDVLPLSTNQYAALCRSRVMRGGSFNDVLHANGGKLTEAEGKVVGRCVLRRARRPCTRVAMPTST